MRGANLPVCRAASLAALATSEERHHADTLFFSMRAHAGAIDAIAELVKRTDATIRCWQQVPVVHVRPFLRACESGLLKEAVARHRPTVMLRDKTKANDILRSLRDSGRLQEIADLIGITVSAIRKWDDVPDRHVAKILEHSFEAKLQTVDALVRPVLRPSASTARVAGSWKRECLRCGAPFTIDSPFVRLCEKHRRDS